MTLIEAMIAVSMIALSISAPLFTADRAIVASQIASNQLTASYLAQEGIEYMRAMRDDEFLSAYKVGGTNVSSMAWSNFLTGADGASITQCQTSTCMLDPTLSMGTGADLSLNPCSGSSCTPLYIANGVYTEQSSANGAIETPFTRTIQATPVTATDEQIVSTVSWNFHGVPYSVSITDHLTPWQ